MKFDGELKLSDSWANAEAQAAGSRLGLDAVVRWVKPSPSS